MGDGMSQDACACPKCQHPLEPQELKTAVIYAFAGHDYSGQEVIRVLRAAGLEIVPAHQGKLMRVIYDRWAARQQ
jgi:hypothetical protein